jgi:hypothetical protein
MASMFCVLYSLCTYTYTYTIYYIIYIYIYTALLTAHCSLLLRAAALLLVGRWEGGGRQLTAGQPPSWLAQ